MKFLSVDIKSGETQERLKVKVLKAIHNSEKKTTPTSSVTHPLQSWSEEVHTLPDLKAEEVVKVVANSSYVAFLLSDGRVCRIRVASWEESSGARKSVSALRQSHESSFQVLGDEEYARQLQAELNSDHDGGWNRIDDRESGWSRPVRLPVAVAPLASSVSRHVERLMPDLDTALLEDSSLTSEWR